MMLRGFVLRTRGLRAVIEAQHAEIEVLRAAQEASAEVIRRLELRLAEVERRLAMDSSNSGTPTSKEGIAVRGAAEGQAAVGAGAQQGPEEGRAARPQGQGPAA